MVLHSPLGVAVVSEALDILLAGSVLYQIAER